MTDEVKIVKQAVSGVLPDHIQEYLDKDVGENRFLDLFQAEEEDVDLKTELTHEELLIVNKIFFNGLFLDSKKVSNLYQDYLEKHMRLRISTDRKSRGEFVDINRKDRFEQNLQRFSHFANLSKVKE